LGTRDLRRRPSCDQSKCPSPAADARLATLERLSQKQLTDYGDPDIAARIQGDEMACKLQSSAPDLMDLSTESKETLDLTDVHGKVVQALLA